MNGSVLPLLRLLGLSLLPVLIIHLISRAYGSSEGIRRVFVFFQLAALAPPFVLGLAILASFGGKALVAGAFLLIAFLPYYLGVFRRGMPVRVAMASDARPLSTLVNSAYRGDSR